MVQKQPLNLITIKVSYHTLLILTQTVICYHYSQKSIANQKGNKQVATGPESANKVENTSQAQLTR